MQPRARPSPRPGLSALLAVASLLAAALLAPPAADAARLRGTDLSRPAGARALGAGARAHLMLAGRRAAVTRVRTGGLTGIAVTARAGYCRRAPVLSIRLDRGRARRARAVRRWRTYRWRLATRAGRHRVAIALANPGGRGRCARRLAVGRIALAERRATRRAKRPVRPVRPAQPSGSPPPASASPDTPFAALAPESIPYRYGGAYAGAFNEPIPSGTGTDPASEAIVSSMTSSMTRERVALLDGGGPPGIWIASAADPLYTVRAAGATFTWRVPPGTTAGGTPPEDSPVVILDPSNPAFGQQVELRLYRASIDHGARTIDAQGYGLFRYGRDSDGLPFKGYGTGSGLSWVGLLRAWDVSHGEIRHALRLTAPVIGAGHRLPATKSDQDGPGPLEMGMRLQLDPAVDCSTRTVPGRDPAGPETRMLRMICRALQRYGAIVVDGSGMTDSYAISMELDRAHGGTADWHAVGGDPPGGYWGNLIRDQLANQTGDGLGRGPSDGIPWQRMRVLATSVFSN
ncbi:MAG: hypothetical protein U0T02_07945 [Solirubrobacteraceae bacterium]